MEKKHNCETCKFRGIYERKPHSILGRIWKWHIGWCPGWKAYTASLTEEERLQLEKDLQQKQHP